jgi:hypothetical protein
LPLRKIRIFFKKGLDRTGKSGGAAGLCDLDSAPHRMSDLRPAIRGEVRPLADIA